MIIGVPKEIKIEDSCWTHARRRAGAGARRPYGPGGDERLGAGSGFLDDAYCKAGAETVPRKTVFSCAELIVKATVVSSEYPLLREDVALFTYLHLAPNPELTRLLLAKQVTGLAYETLERDGNSRSLPP